MMYETGIESDILFVRWQSGATRQFPCDRSHSAAVWGKLRRTARIISKGLQFLRHLKGCIGNVRLDFSFF